MNKKNCNYKKKKTTTDVISSDTVKATRQLAYVYLGLAVGERSVGELAHIDGY